MDTAHKNLGDNQVQFERMSDDLVLPANIKTRAWNVWLDISNKSSKVNTSTGLVEWFSLSVYIAVVDSCMPYGPSDPHLHMQSPPYVTLTELLKITNCSVVKLIEKSVMIPEHVCISEAVKHHMTNVEKRYNILSPLSMRFNREWGTVFREDEKISALPFSETEGSQYKKELCWLLFLHAKDGLMSDNWELAHVYHLLLCCLEYILRNTPSFQLLSPYDTLRLKLAENLDQNGYNVALLKKLAENFQADFDELTTMQKETDPFFESLKTKDGDIDLINLRNSYHDDYKRTGGLDELLFLQQDSHLMPDQNKSPRSGSTANSETPLTPVRAALNTQQQLKRILSTPVCEPSPELKQYFQNCSNNPESSINERLESLKTRFCTCYTQKTGRSDNTTAEQRFKQATILYYRVMTALLDMEKERLSLSDFSNLLNNDKFHRSLLACSTEIVLVIFNILWRPPSSVTADGDNCFMFPWILEVFDLYAYDFYKVLESFIKAEPNLTREIVMHLTSIENRILDTIAWKSDSPVHVAIEASDSITTSVNSPSKAATNGNGSPSSAAELYLSPVKGQRTRGTSPGKIVFASPRKANTSGTVIYSREGNTDAQTNGNPRRSQSLTLFFNKVCRLGYRRMIMLCDLLLVPKDTQQKIWTCFEYCITSRPELIKNRHLDQIMMCSLYGICKVLESEIKFKDIVRCYSTLQHADPETYRHVFIEGDMYDSIICFYNRVFMQNMKNFILQFARVMQPNLSPVPKPVTPLTASPVYRLPGRQNFFVSPLNESPFKAPHSPGSMTPISRQLYCFGDLLGSSEKLKTINESLSAFKSRNSLPYVTTPKRASLKRLDFDQAEEQNNLSQADDTVPVIVKKKRVNPPSPVTTRSSSRANGDLK